MQYCSLQHQTFLSQPDTSTSEPHLCFGPTPSFFLKIFLHSSPVVYWILEQSLEGLMPKLKLQYFGHLIWRANSLEKTLVLGKTEGGRSGDDRGWDGWMGSLNEWTWVWVNSGSWWWTGRPGMLQSMGLQRVRHDWVTELNLLLISAYLHGTQPPKSLQMVIAAMKLKDAYSLEGKLWPT